MIHYHIRWANLKLDWESFPTQRDAEIVANQLKRPGENYVIEELDGDCQQCKSLTTQGQCYDK